MSENIFTELYNRVISLFRQTENNQENAKSVACNRLRVVLMQDRTNITPELLQRMRKELVDLLSKYVEMDKEALELNIEQEGEQMALMLSIPVIRAKDEEEIEQLHNTSRAQTDEEKEENFENQDIKEKDEEIQSSDEDENLEEDEASEQYRSEEDIKKEDENASEDEDSEDAVENKAPEETGKNTSSDDNSDSGTQKKKTTKKEN